MLRLLRNLKFKAWISLLVLGLLALSAYLVLDRAIGQATHYTQQVNEAGRQRMRVSTIKSMLYRLDPAQSDALSIDQSIRSNLKELIDVHYRIAPEIRQSLGERGDEILKPAEYLIMSFKDLIELSILPQKQIIGFEGDVEGLVSQIIKAHDSITLAIETSSTKTIHAIRLQQGSILLLTIAALLVVGFGIFRPLLRKLDEEVTAQAVTAASLRRNEKTLSAILQTTVDGIITIAENGTVLTYNHAAENIFNYQPEEVIGNSINMLMPKSWARDHDQYIQNYLKTGKAKIIGIGREVIGRRKDGSTFPLDLAVSHFVLDGENFFTGVVRDITERKENEMRLAAYMEKLATSNKDLEHFASIVSHDLQEPLRKIQAFGDRLQSKCAEELPEVGRDYIARMNNAAERMKSLINDLLSYSRITTRATEPKTVNIATIVREVCSDLMVRIEETKGTIHCNADVELVADETQMRQLLQNLIGNALKFRRDDVDPVIEVTAEVLTELPIKILVETPAIHLQVKDNSIGFDEKYLDRIFLVFQRLHARGKYEGTGIGLAICRRIVGRHGGVINATSQVGEGSTFSIYIPQKTSFLINTADKNPEAREADK